MAGIKGKKVAEMKEINNVMYRKCTYCDEFKTLDNFYSNCKDKPYWIDSVCKDCRKQKAINRQKEKHDEILEKKRVKKLEVRGIQPPFNYMGNKYLLLPQMMPLLPQNIDTAVDLFCGSTTVGVNLEAKKIICNDRNTDMIDFYKFCKNNDADYIINTIKKTIVKYDLANNEQNNVDNFNKLRQDFNQGSKEWNMFYTLVTYSYNQNPTYNKKGEYSTGYGKQLCWFNPMLEKRMIEFVNKIKEINIEFVNRDFKDMDLNSLGENDLVYADPPYLISSKTYEWNLDEEKALLDILDKLNEQGVKFALSNVLKHKKGLNTLLYQWSKKYNTYRLQRNYQRINRGRSDDTFSTEVLITNYK